MLPPTHNAPCAHNKCIFIIGVYILNDEAMKNVTLSVEENLLRVSREYAQNHHTSLNNLIRKYLQNTASKQSTLWIDECLSLMDRC